MKKILAVGTLILCMASFTPSFAFARGYGHGGHGGHNYGYHSGGHYHDGFGLGIAAGIAGGLLGSALIYSAAPPPPAVVYGAPYSAYPPAVVVQPPKICFEDRLVNGEWQISRYDGRQVWVPFQYPATQRVQIPCY